MIKYIIKRIFLFFGLEVKKKKKNEKDLLWLKKLDIKTIIDIGANVGQFAKEIHEILPDAKIFSFEPLKECYLELKKQLSSEANFEVFNVALGDKNAKVEINKNDFSASSSLLKMTELHQQAFPYTKNSSPEEIEIRRLDDLISALVVLNNILIKIDVQGFEDKVILGGQKTLSRAKVVFIELSYETLYKNQPLFNDIYSKLFELGFSYHGNLYQLKSPIDGRVLQSDGIFIRGN